MQCIQSAPHFFASPRSLMQTAWSHLRSGGMAFVFRGGRSLWPRLGLFQFLCQRPIPGVEGDSPIFADTKIGTVPRDCPDLWPPSDKVRLAPLAFPFPSPRIDGRESTHPPSPAFVARQQLSATHTPFSRMPTRVSQLCHLPALTRRFLSCCVERLPAENAASRRGGAAGHSGEPAGRKSGHRLRGLHRAGPTRFNRWTSAPGSAAIW